MLLLTLLLLTTTMMMMMQLVSDEDLSDDDALKPMMDEMRNIESAGDLERTLLSLLTTSQVGCLQSPVKGGKSGTKPFRTSSFRSPEFHKALPNLVFWVY
jgi:hypothetical protein